MTEHCLQSSLAAGQVVLQTVCVVCQRPSSSGSHQVFAACFFVSYKMNFSLCVLRKSQDSDPEVS